VADGDGWSNMSFLMKQVAQLKQEKEILPPPDDMVH
jgi:dihydroxyacetone kinase-like predicted kinase